MQREKNESVTVALDLSGCGLWLAPSASTTDRTGAYRDPSLPGFRRPPFHRGRHVTILVVLPPPVPIRGCGRWSLSEPTTESYHSLPWYATPLQKWICSRVPGYVWQRLGQAPGSRVNAGVAYHRQRCYSWVVVRRHGSTRSFTSHLICEPENRRDMRSPAASNHGKPEGGSTCRRAARSGRREAHSFTIQRQTHHHQRTPHGLAALRPAAKVLTIPAMPDGWSNLPHSNG